MSQTTLPPALRQCSIHERYVFRNSLMIGQTLQRKCTLDVKLRPLVEVMPLSSLYSCPTALPVDVYPVRRICESHTPYLRLKTQPLRAQKPSCY